MRRFLAAANQQAAQQQQGGAYAAGGGRAAGDASAHQPPGTVNSSFTVNQRHHDELDVDFQIGNSFTTRGLAGRHRKQQKQAPPFLLNRPTLAQQQQQQQQHLQQQQQQQQQGNGPALSRTDSPANNAAGGAPTAAAAAAAVAAYPGPGGPTLVLGSGLSLTQQGPRIMSHQGSSVAGGGAACLLDDAQQWTPTYSGASIVGQHPNLGGGDGPHNQRRFMTLLDKQASVAATGRALNGHARNGGGNGNGAPLLPADGDGGRLLPVTSVPASVEDDAHSVTAFGGAPAVPALVGRESGSTPPGGGAALDEYEEDDYEENVECYHEVHAIPLLDPVLDKQVRMLGGAGLGFG